MLSLSSDVFSTSGEKKFSFRRRNITKIVKDIFGYHVETVEGIVVCKCSSCWNKRIGFVFAICRSSGNIEILYKSGQVAVFLF